MSVQKSSRYFQIVRNKTNPGNLHSKILTLWLLLLSMSFAVSFFRVFLGNYPLYQIWSFQAEDPPYVPPGVKIKPIFYSHYFGDFTSNSAWSTLSNPYDPKLPPIGNTPLGNTIWNFFGVLPNRISFTIFVFLGLTLLWMATGLALQCAPLMYQSIYRVLLCGFSLPVIIDIDRGNSAGIAIACFSIAALKLCETSKSKKSSNTFLVTICLIISISLKPYIIVPTIFLLLFFNKKIVSFALFYAFLINLIESFTIPGGPMLVIRNILDSIGQQLGSQDAGWIYGGVNIHQLFLRLIARFYCDSRNINLTQCATVYRPYLFPVMVLWILLMGYLCRKFRSNPKLVIIFIMTFMQVIPAVAGPYTLIWAVIGCGLFIGLISELSYSRILATAGFLCFFILIGPIPVSGAFRINHLSGWQELPPLALLFLIPILYLMGNDSIKQYVNATKK